MILVFGGAYQGSWNMSSGIMGYRKVRFSIVTTIMRSIFPQRLSVVLRS